MKICWPHPTILMILLTAPQLMGCKTQQFNSQQKIMKPEKGTPKSAKSENALHSEVIASSSNLPSALWQWPCEGKGRNLDPSHFNFFFDADGEHEISKNIKSFELAIEGAICVDNLEIERDIVVVIDVSGSMITNDSDYKPGISSIFRSTTSIGTANTTTILQGTELEVPEPEKDSDLGSFECYREKAVHSLLSLLGKDPNTKTGLVTFSDGIEKNSRMLMQPEGLRQNYIQRENGNLLCDAVANTNYVAAFEGALQMFRSYGRSSAKPVILFVTDGLPSTGGDSSSKAAEVRRQATIATAFIGYAQNGSEFLRTQIASKLPNGEPFHADARNASELEGILNQFAKETLSSVTFRYRAKGSSSWQKRETVIPDENGDFVRPNLIISQEKYPNGFEFKFEFKNNRGETYTKSGIIKFR